MELMNFFKSKVLSPVHTVDSAIEALTTAADNLAEVVSNTASEMLSLEHRIAEDKKRVAGYKTEIERADRIRTKLLDIVK